MKVLFAGGGTGGHLYPAVAMAEELLNADTESSVVFAGTERGIEAVEVPRLGYRLHLLKVRGFRRGFSVRDLFNNAGVLADFLRSVLRAAAVIRSEQPDVVVGTGGFVSGPVLFAAQLLGRKTLIQEQNAFPGMTTRFLAYGATEVHLSFEESRKYVKKRSGVYVTGNPARSFDLVDPADGRRAFGLERDLPTLLVFGGSRGARSINNAVKARLEEMKDRCNLIWQTGSLDYDGLAAEVSPSPGVWMGPYINDMRLAYSAADLVLCRAGASTIAELTNLGQPAVLVPYPYATGDHQYHNARALVDVGASELIRDSDIGGDEAFEKVFGLLGDRGRLERMASACRAQGRPEAARELAGRIRVLADA